MSLKQQTFKVSNIETKDYDDVHFIPDIVDGKEVYEVKNSSNIHCGYVTEAFLEALTKVNDDQGRVNRNFVVRQTQEWAGNLTLSKGGDITLLSRKIILDAPKEPSKILVQGVVLRPTIYPEEMEDKALTIATSCFRIMSPFCPLDIKVNHDFIEAEAFSIVRVGGTADKSVTINLDLIKTSAIKGPVRFSGVTTIEDAMIDKVNFEDGKVTSIVGGNYVSNGETIDGSSYAINGKNTKTGKVTEELELL